MKRTIIFILLAGVCLVHSNDVGKSFAEKSADVNMIDNDHSAMKQPRIQNNPPQVVDETEYEMSTTTKIKIFKFIFVPAMSFLLSFLVKSSHALAGVHILFGILIGIFATVAMCHWTPYCSISAAPEILPTQKMMELLTTENIQSLTRHVDNAIETMEVLRKLS